MNTTHLIRFLTGAFLGVAMPSIACFGWYSLESVDNTNVYMRAVVAAAYPATLISMTFLMLALSSSKRSWFYVWISSLSLALALAVVLVTRI